MCGIAGTYFLNDNHSPVDSKATTEALLHRGPDHQAQAEIGPTHFIHSRLAIIDTSDESNQPMSDETGRYHLIYNGEIYNYRSIKSQLQNKGITFSTDGDTEVVLKQLIVKGIEGLSEMNGFFSLAFYDKQDDILIVARDRYGIKPLIYHFNDDKLVFASELRALESMISSSSINMEAMHLFFNLNYIPGPSTIYENVQKLLPGEYLHVEGRKVSISRFYNNDYNLQKESSLSFDQAKEKLKDLLDQAVQDRLIADVPVGTFLSGGLDSSIIATLASRHQNNIESFSVGFKTNKYFDESNYAAMVAKKAGTNHNLILLEENDLLECIDDFLLAIDEPFADSSALAYFLLSKHTRKKVTVALSGDGADELLAGYNKYVALEKSFGNGFGNFAIKNLGPLFKFIPSSRSSKFGNKARQLSKYSNGLNMSDFDRYWSWCGFTPEEEVRKLINKKVDFSKIDEMKNSFLTKKERYSINEILLADQNLVMCNDMLFKADKMSMANSLEVRVPFLDHNVVEFVRSLPEKYKLHNGNSKYILREAFRDDLPQEILERPKKGFEVPLESWFNGPLKEKLLANLSEELIVEQDLFDPIYISSIRSKIMKNDIGEIIHLLWALFVFQSFWLRIKN
ncbi:MAG: asparagine synthase (glutamine-hydrolyzing) [Gammaproteobacteria bacterium]|jgi:asparagine synthase (glutamine-hydrolysing)